LLTFESSSARTGARSPLREQLEERKLGGESAIRITKVVYRTKGLSEALDIVLKSIPKEKDWADIDWHGSLMNSIRDIIVASDYAVLKDPEETSE
jgi:hypothetical protein